MKKQPGGPTSRNYDPAKIEKKWQKKWEADKLYVAKDNSKAKKFYGLIEFPYPSGDGLHVGHIRSNTAMDIIARKRRREGFNVLYPIGWDAFGLPTENYAIKTGIQPAVVTKKNTDTFRRQLKEIGFSFDWSREVNTTDPKYYKWTQWIFLQFLKKGLAYKKSMTINWCPKDLIGLANEEVIDGKCERCGTPVEKKEKEQWMLAITKYADRLLSDLDAIDTSNIPHIIDSKNSPKPGKKTVERRTIQALVRDPKTGKFLGLKWKKFPWTTFVIGGVEDGEDIISAAKREVLEETGYSDIKLTQILGGPVKSEYFAAHKDENRLAITSAVLFELVSDSKREVSADEKAKHEPVWMEMKDMNDKVMTCSELPIWLERMPDSKPDFTGKVPCFTQVWEPGTVKQGQPFVERNAILAIVKHWSEDKFIGLKWKKVDWRTLITGGIEKGQSAEQAAIAEIIEETGYLHPKLKKDLGKLESKFFHVPKNENRYAHFDVLYFELKDSKRNALSEDEYSKHEVVWVDRKEMDSFNTPMAMRYVWKTMFCKKPIDFSSQAAKPLLDWTESIKELQRNWIGKSEGVNLSFKVKDMDLSFEMYDSIPQTFMAQTFTVIAPEHEAVAKLVAGTEFEKPVMEFVQRIKQKKAEKGFDHVRDMEGIFTGRYIDYGPAKRQLPIWVASYVLADYGSGIVNCSYHDERDYAFAKKYNIPLHPVLFPEDPILAEKVRKQEIMYREPDGTLEEPVQFKGRRWDEVRKDIIDYIVENGWGTRTTQYKLRDWIFSRQRYWGEPIPVVHCQNCAIKDPKGQGIVPVPEKDLPVLLPKVKNYKPTENGESPLAAIKKWVNVKCPKCKGPAKRETDTMPNWAGSSWYYLRYADPKNKTKFADLKKLKYWTPVDWYNGGMEHTTLHLLYSRFWHKFLYDLNLVPTIEPYTKRTSHGPILAEDGMRMSKSRGNVINPDTIVKSVGADTLRLYEMFMGPFDQSIAWDMNNIAGVRRFIEKVWKLKEKVDLTNKVIGKTLDSRLRPTSSLADSGLLGACGNDTVIDNVIHKTIKKVSDDIETMRFNTAMSSLMIVVNELEKSERISKDQFEIILQLLAPFAPHVTEELWHAIGNKKSIHISSWPKYDPEMAKDSEVKMMVQVNGKVRGSFMVNVDQSEEEVKQMALGLEETKKWIEGKEVKKVIVVKRKLVSIVI